MNYNFHQHLTNNQTVPAYQPEASYDIFMRALFNKDIATGTIDISDDFVSHGPSDTWHIKNIPPKMPESVCYILKPDTCTPEQWAAVMNDTAVVEDYKVVSYIYGSELDRLRDGQSDKEQQPILPGEYEEL